MKGEEEEWEDQVVNNQDVSRCLNSTLFFTLGSTEMTATKLPVAALVGL